MLSAAAQREDRCLVAPPALKGAAAQKVVNRLISSGLVKEVKATTGAPIWRRDEEAGQSYALKLTVVGAKAIAIDESLEPEHGDDEGGLLENVDQAAVPSTLRALDYPPAEARDSAPGGPPAPRSGSSLPRGVVLLLGGLGATLPEPIRPDGV